MARQTPEEVLSSKWGAAQADSIIHRLDKAGYCIIAKSDRLAFERAAAKLEKQKNGKPATGTKTGRMSAKDPRTQKVSSTPLEAAEKLREAAPAEAERLKQATAPKRTITRRVRV